MPGQLDVAMSPLSLIRVSLQACSLQDRAKQSELRAEKKLDSTLRNSSPTANLRQFLSRALQEVIYRSIPFLRHSSFPS